MNIFKFIAATVILFCTIGCHISSHGNGYFFVTSVPTGYTCAISDWDDNIILVTKVETLNETTKVCNKLNQDLINHAITSTNDY
jgi:hypothetical protein